MPRSVDLVDFMGMTALHMAAERGLDDAVAVLVAVKVEVNARNSDGANPLHYAAVQDNSEMLRTLIDAKPVVNASDRSHDTPLHRACEEGLHVVVVQKTT